MIVVLIQQRGCNCHVCRGVIRGGFWVLCSPDLNLIVYTIFNDLSTVDGFDNTDVIEKIIMSNLGVGGQKAGVPPVGLSSYNTEGDFTVGVSAPFLKRVFPIPAC